MDHDQALVKRLPNGVNRQSGRAMEEIRASLLNLAARPDRLTHVRLWHALTKEEREQAVRAALRQEDWEERNQFLTELAESLRFRVATIRAWSSEKLASHAARADGFNRQLVDGFLRDLHLSERVPLLTTFLDSLGVQHDRGVANAGLDEAPGRPEQIAVAADALLETFPPNQVFLYLLTLLWLHPQAFEGLKSWFAALVSTKDTLVPPETEAAVTGPATPIQVDPETFTTLDRRLVRVIVDAAQGIDGAPSEDELDDLVEEIIHLNGDRQRSFFHSGLRDAMFNRSPQTELAAQNQPRREWYLAGFIQGLARRQAWSEIVKVYDDDRIARQLGTSGKGASGAAARWIYRALCEMNRHAEGARFLTPAAVAHLSGALATDLLNQGTTLVRGERSADAKLTLTLLCQALEIGAHNGRPARHNFQQEARRRLAHAYRQLGEVGRARDVLEGLLNEAQPDRRSMILTDLGILACGYRRLSDLRLPLEEEDIAPFRETLERGEPFFREALEEGDTHTSHAHYCLGILTFARGQFEAALTHLDEAVSGFESNPVRYRSAGLLDTARLYLGLAICHALAVGRMERAQELIREACREGAKIPPYLVKETLVALEMGPEAFGCAAAEAILEASGTGVLDSLAAVEVSRGSRSIASALLMRCRDSNRGSARRLSDGFAVLPFLLRQDRHDEAEEVLDMLELAALGGQSLGRFLELLERPENYEPAWNTDDAFWCRVTCLESAGRYDDAQVELERLFHRLLGAKSYGYLDEAGDLIERIQAYGLGSSMSHLSQRLDAEREIGKPVAEEPRDPRAVVRVLVVGGNESQEQYDEPIREALRVSHPNIEVDFEHTGWTSNWGRQLDDITRRLPNYDVVVIMRLIRTMLGRRLRASLGSIPWRACGGRGKMAIMNALLLAAQTVKGRLRLGW